MMSPSAEAAYSHAIPVTPPFPRAASLPATFEVSPGSFPEVSDCPVFRGPAAPLSAPA